MVREIIRFTLNGEAVTLDTDPSRRLLWALRTELARTGTKYGCGAGFCGSCTVLVDGEAVRACTAGLDSVQGKNVITIEGLASNGDLHPLQKEFYERGAYQCGYCTPGMIMNAVALVQNNPNPTREEIIQGMEGNLCRCSAYKRIIEAVEAYAGRVTANPGVTAAPGVRAELGTGAPAARPGRNARSGTPVSPRTGAEADVKGGHHV